MEITGVEQQRGRRLYQIIANEGKSRSSEKVKKINERTKSRLAKQTTQYQKI